jgi:hypothetical protein
MLNDQYQNNLFAALTAPHVLLRARLFVDGDQWCALYGEMPWGLAGFGPTPREACNDFDYWYDHGKPHPGIHNPVDRGETE